MDNTNVVKTYSLKNQIIKYIIYTLIVLGLTFLALYLTCRNNYKLVIETLGQAKIGYIFLIVGIIAGCILFRSLSNFLLTRMYVSNYKFHRSVVIDQVGTLYRMVTPVGVGGHLMEVFTFRKQKVSVSNALSIIAMYSICYQIALITYNIITIIVKRDLIGQIGSIPISFTSSSSVYIPLWILISIGFIFNLGVIGIIFLLSFSKRFYNFISKYVLRFLCFIRIVKDIDKARYKLEESVTSFRGNLRSLLTHYKTLILTVLLMIGYITISYSIPYICGLSLNNTSINASFFDSVLLSNFHQMITCIIPLPGNAVLSEMFFLQLFYPSTGPKFYASEDIARASLLLWRSLTFIIPLFIACIVTITYHPRNKTTKEVTSNGIN